MLTLNEVHVVVQCRSNCAIGRRPAGVSDSTLLVVDHGSYFANAARLEALSVVAFRQLRAELTAHRAPRRLLAAPLARVRAARVAAAKALHEELRAAPPCDEEARIGLPNRSEAQRLFESGGAALVGSHAFRVIVGLVTVLRASLNLARGGRLEAFAACP